MFALLAMGAAACGSSTPLAGGANSGAARVVVWADSTDIASVTVTVGQGRGSGFAPIVSELSRDGPRWSGLVQNIPPGPDRQFDAVARDKDGKRLYAGAARSDIEAGAISIVSILLEYLPVIDRLWSSASTVAIGTALGLPSVSLSVAAHSPNTPPDALTYGWTASCGDIAGSTTITPTWTAPQAVPASGACQVSVTVTDQHQGSVTAYLAISVEAVPIGNPQVNAYPNAWPIITGVVAGETFTRNASGQIIAIDVDATVSAVDPDGDDLSYAWSSTCAYPAAGFTSADVTAMAAALTASPGAIASDTVHFRSNDPTHGCTIRVDVRDYWKNGIVPAGSGLPAARGGDTVGLIYASTPTDTVFAPQITAVFQPNASDQVQPGQTIVIGIQARDPTPNLNTAQTPFTYTWMQTGGAFVAGSEADVTSSPGTSAIQWTAPATLVPGLSATVTVKNVAGLTATYTFNFVPASACALPGSNGLACDTGLGLCAPNGGCLNGACVSPAPVTCAALDQCHVAGICNPATGTCSNPPQPPGTTCNDGDGCTTGDVCSATGSCFGAAVVCNTPPDAACHAMAGTCSPTGDSTFACGYANLPDGVSCASDACQTGQSCLAGVCQGGTPFCPAGQSCTPGTPPTCR